MENQKSEPKPERAEQPSGEGLSSSVLFAQALQQRKDHLSCLISDSVTASGGKISDELLPHMEARKAIDTLLNYFGAKDPSVSIAAQSSANNRSDNGG